MLGQFVSWSGVSSVGMGESGPGPVAHPVAPPCAVSIGIDTIYIA